MANDNRGLSAAVAIVCSALALLGADASAQSAAPSSAEARKTVRMVRTATPPVIDGKLDEAIWQTADVITDFHQIRPGDGAAPSEPTEVYLLYDDDAFYIGARMHDSEPQLIAGADGPARPGIGARRSARGDPRPVQHGPQRLSLRDQRQRRAPRRALQEHQLVPERLDGHLGHGRDHRRDGLGRRDGDSVQVTAVRPFDHGLGFQLRARHPPARRGDGVGVAQPHLQPEHPRARHRDAGHGPRHGSRRRAVAGGWRAESVRERRRGSDRLEHEPVARCVLSVHAVAERRAHDQHGFLGDRSRQLAKSTSRASICSSPRSATSS